MSIIKRLFSEEKAQFMIDYVLLTALVSIVCIGMIGFITAYSSKLQTLLESVNQALH